MMKDCVNIFNADEKLRRFSNGPFKLSSVLLASDGVLFLTLGGLRATFLGTFI
jgi:hypothetical protein